MADTQLEAPSRSRSETVLVVDDDVRVVELLQITLGGRGYQVLSAYDGETALRTIQHHNPDLVVLDVRLPKRSGFDVLETVRRAPGMKALPIVLISANAATETRLQGLKLGADDYLTKPFSPRELIMKIRRLLDRAEDRKVLALKNEALEDEVARHRSSLHELHHEMNRNLSRIGGVLDQVLHVNQAASADELLERFVATTLGSLDFERLALLTRDPEGIFRARVWRGLGDPEARAVRLNASSFVTRVLTSVERAVQVEELDRYPEARAEVQRLAAAGFSLLVPALHEHTLRGVLALGDRSGGVSRFDLKMLEILGNAVAAALRQVETAVETRRAFVRTTAMLIATVEGRYPFMSGHSERVAETALAIGRRLSLTAGQMESLRSGALLHDLGELHSYGELLDAPQQLTREQREVHRREVVDRVASTLDLRDDTDLAEILRHQHEWWDGSGIPSGLRGRDIPVLARVVALANAWDALRHPRPHRAEYESTQAVRILEQRAGVQFDPDLVPLLLQIELGAQSMRGMPS